jgi:hypothetical protein
MAKSIFPIGFGLLLVSLAPGCGLVGWHGTPSADQVIQVEGTMAVRDLPERDSLWTIETDTVAFVPKGLPAAFEQEGLSVRAKGSVGEPPAFYPEGRYLDLQSIQRLN